MPILKQCFLYCLFDNFPSTYTLINITGDGEEILYEHNFDITFSFRNVDWEGGITYDSETKSHIAFIKDKGYAPFDWIPVPIEDIIEEIYSLAVQVLL